MPSLIHFTRECPTCGRSLSIDIRLLGRQVACQHCRAEFTATHCPPAAEPIPCETSPLLRRADELLKQTNSVSIH